MQWKRLTRLHPLLCSEVGKVGAISWDREVVAEEFEGKEEGPDMPFSEGKSVVPTVALTTS
jgi:hypothetical protein